MGTDRAQKVAVLGAGTWGIALARLLCLSGKQVTVWSALPQELETLAHTGVHPKLPGVELPPQLHYTGSLSEACTGQDMLVFAVPSVYVRQTARAARPFVPHGMIVVDAAKGIENDTLMTMTEVIADELQDPTVRLVALSGPTHAEEVARDMFTTIVAACRDHATAEYVQRTFTTRALRVYTSVDIRGIEVCGALKNVIALAVGISHGLGYGDNARAALITRGLAELTRLGEKLHCHPQTFSGLTGMGDLIVTCTSRHSRNNRCGELIGLGRTPQQAVEEVGMVVEGLYALPAAVRLAELWQVDMPIVQSVHAIVDDGVPPQQAVELLLSRALRSELPTTDAPADPPAMNKG